MKHEIIYTEHYALIVSDEEIKEKDWFFNGEHVLQASRITDIIIDTEGQWSEIKTSKKVIAHRPLEDAPILEGVPLLPEFNKKDDVEKKSRDFVKYVGGSQEQRLAFIDGYLEAKETYKYTVDDMIACWKYASMDKHQIIGDQIGDHYLSFIQSLQQPKRPKCFECEMEQLPSNESFGLDYGSFNLKPKTITNSQNQTELVGEYIYE
jgi:hypothetical protein